MFGKTQKGTLKQLHQLIDLYRDVDLTEECRMTLGEWLDKWLDEYMIFTLRDSTIQGYRAIINNQIKKFIGSKPLTSLTTAEIQKFYNRIKKEGRAKPDPIKGTELADSMVRKTHMLLHEALEKAVEEHLIVVNPTNGTTIPKNNYQEKQVLNDSQLETFLEAIKQEPYWHDFFYLEIMTGLRRGEICGIKWEDINFDEGTLTVKRSVGKDSEGKLTAGETKTTAGNRKIILPPSVLSMLESRKTNTLSEWVFPTLTNPLEPLSPTKAYGKLKEILKSAGLPSIRFHDLRHTFATHAMKSGVDAKTLSGILGHTNASFTLDTYTHVTTDMQKNASNIVGSFMDEIML